jgi:hypothetical protein
MSNNDDFEKLFSKYIDSEKYDMAEDFLFSIIRGAYKSGWHDAEKYYLLNSNVSKKRIYKKMKNKLRRTE